MIRIFRRFPKNSVRHWRAIATYAAMGSDATLLRPELVAGPYVLLADMVPAPGDGACVAGAGAALAVASSLAFMLRLPEETSAKPESFC